MNAWLALMPVSPLSPFGPTRLVLETGLNVMFFPVAVICAYIRFLPPLVMAKKYSPTTGARLKLSARQSKSEHADVQYPDSMRVMIKAGNPVSPRWPASPFAPVAPVAPVAPAGPCGPCTPCLPCGPVSPLGPLTLPSRIFVICAPYFPSLIM